MADTAMVAYISDTSKVARTTGFADSSGGAYKSDITDYSDSARTVYIADTSGKAAYADSAGKA